MPGPLVDSFRSDLPCSDAEAELLADAARAYVTSTEAAGEDSDEDTIVRLRDPRVFGGFAVSLLEDGRLPASTRAALAERSFDLLPLPRSEGDVMFVPSRSPEDLLRLTLFLARGERLTVIHIMHVVYAVFLDRSLIARTPENLRSEVLGFILGDVESSERLRALYACFHLSVVPETEAHRDFGGILKDRTLPVSLRALLARIAVSEDGGVAEIAKAARDEGLLPEDSEELDAPQTVANVPRLPTRLVAMAKPWLRHHDGA